MKMRRSIGRKTTMVLFGILLCCEVPLSLAGAETEFESGRVLLSQCDFEQEAKLSLIARWPVCPGISHDLLKESKILDDANLALSFSMNRLVGCEPAGTSTADRSCSHGEARLAQSKKNLATRKTKESGGEDPRTMADVADRDLVKPGRPLTTEQKRIFVLGLGAGKKD